MVETIHEVLTVVKITGAVADLQFALVAAKRKLRSVTLPRPGLTSQNLPFSSIFGIETAYWDQKGPLYWGPRRGVHAPMTPSGSATALESWQVWKELPVDEISE